MILTAIPGTVFQLDAPAEASWQRMKDAGNPAGLTTAYRDAAYQQRLYNGWLARLPGYNFALPPGHSMHELGLAVDVTQVTANWMATHGAAYGWERPAGWNAAGITNPEWWHFEYSILRDTKTFATPTPVVAIPTPTIEEDSDMAAFSVHVMTATPNGAPAGDWTLGHHEIGADLAPAASRKLFDDGKGGVVVEYQGFMVTNIASVGVAWARIYAGGAGNETSRVVHDDYVQIQKALALVAQSTSTAKA